jgi:hypothetical protein
MKDVIFIIYHLLTTVAKLLRPGGSRAIIAENLLLKHMLSGPAGRQSGQGMGQVLPWAKYSTDCRSGANGQQLGGDYMVI